MKYLTSLKLAICNHIKGSGYSYRYKRNLSRLPTSFFVLVLLLMFKAQTLPTLQEYFFRASQQYPEGRSKSSSGLTNSQKKLREMLVLMEVERTTPIGSTAIATSLSTKSARRGTVSAEATARQQARTRVRVVQSESQPVAVPRFLSCHHSDLPTQTETQREAHETLSEACFVTNTTHKTSSGGRN